ncbi:MAG TPA: chemotaxis protein CheC [Gemmatimonadaceae bacterium]|nr:chemotaxis protein CheC [Gemmatimonadaceae bacterium]
MADLLSLSPVELDALRETASIGAGHAATALSQMTGSRIMITVPRLTIAALEDVPRQIDDGEEPIAAVMMQMLGDLTGRSLLVFPHPTAVRLAHLMLRRPHVPGAPLGELEQSALKEAGNILAGAYLNALSEFLGLMLLPSPPSLAVDMSQAVLTTAYTQFGAEKDVLFAVETQFLFDEGRDQLRGYFLLLPDLASLRVILRAVRLS